MPRPPCRRRVEGKPAVSMFRPAGLPARGACEIVITLDEFEAVRLADLERLYHEAASGKMGVSRPTFGRILDAARRKIADAIVNGKAFRIEGGPVFERVRRLCGKCSAEWVGPPGCPRCKWPGNPALAPDRHGRRRAGFGAMREEVPFSEGNEE